MPKILVADDSIAVRKVAERLLTEAGLGVTLAANGEEALALLAKEVPDLIVSDVIMPDKSGYEVCAFVRGQAALAKTPVLLISGIVNDEVTKQHLPNLPLRRRLRRPPRPTLRFQQSRRTSLPRRSRNSNRSKRS